MGFHLVEDTHAITFLVNTQFHSSGRLGYLEGANHGGSAFDGVSLAAHRFGVGATHGLDAGAGIFHEGGNDLPEGVERHSAAQMLKDRGIEDGCGAIVVSLGSGFGCGTKRKRGAESVERERLVQDAVVAFDGHWRRGAHGEQDGLRHEPAQTVSEFGAGQAGHAEIGEHAVGRFAVSKEVQRLLAAGGL